MSDQVKKRPIFRKKEEKKEDEKPEEKDEPLQLEMDFNFGGFFDSSDPEELL